MDRIVFLQLPPPRFSFEDAPANIPLAAGFLTAALEVAGSGSLAPDIIGSHIADVFADEALALAIAEQKPAVLGLSLYVWNVQRSLFLASNIKRRSPGTRVLVGGPEVTPDNEWVLGHPAVDAGVFGEGESRIARLCEALARGDEPVGIPGTFYTSSRGIEVNGDSPTHWDLNAAPYPYLDGKITPSLDGTLFLETVRGCLFRCRYCYYHKAFSDIRLHPSLSIEEVLNLAYSKDSPVREIYLMDPSFNARRGYRELLEFMARKRNAKDLAIHTELRADLLNTVDVSLLKEAGLRSAEIGLQSFNPAALRAAGRSGDPDRVLTGAASLKDAGIEVTVGIILGLPEDTPEGFRETLRRLKDSQAYSVVHPFVLSVLPGTDFRERASVLGLQYDSRPPYHVKSTPTFPADEFRPRLLEYEEIFDVELDHIPRPSFVDRGPAVTLDLNRGNYVSKWIVNPRFHDKRRQMLPMVIAKASDPFTIWFRGTFKEPVILEMISEFLVKNPHAVLNVIFDLDRAPRVSFLEKVMDSVADPSLFLNRSYASLFGESEAVTPDFTAILPWSPERRTRERDAEQYASVAVPVWDVGADWSEAVFTTDAHLLFSRSFRESDPEFRSFFDMVEKSFRDRPEEIHFRDRFLKEEWRRRCKSTEPASALPESIFLSL